MSRNKPEIEDHGCHAEQHYRKGDRYDKNDLYRSNQAFKKVLEEQQGKENGNSVGLRMDQIEEMVNERNGRKRNDEASGMRCEEINMLLILSPKFLLSFPLPMRTYL